MSATVTVGHNFETAHRLPHLPGKCESLHGHSWWVDVTVAGEVDGDGVLVEFGSFKAALRDWIDSHLDHGVMLGENDALAPLLAEHGTKVFTVAGWPTVECVAEMLADVARVIMAEHEPYGVRVVAVEVHETRTNSAGWRA